MNTATVVGEYGPIQDGWTFWKRTDVNRRPVRVAPDGEITYFDSSHQAWIVRLGETREPLVEIREEDLPKTARRCSRKASGWPRRTIEVLYFLRGDPPAPGIGLEVFPGAVLAKDPLTAEERGAEWLAITGADAELDELVERFFSRWAAAYNVSVGCDDLAAAKAVAEGIAARLRRLDRYRVTLGQHRPESAE